MYRFVVCPKDPMQHVNRKDVPESGIRNLVLKYKNQYSIGMEIDISIKKLNKTDHELIIMEVENA